MAADGEDDPEDHLLEEARKVLGERVPVVASFDLHGVLTARMLRHTDATVVYHTYPHIDFAEAGQRAARLLLRLLDGEARPVTARVEIPAWSAATNSSPRRGGGQVAALPAAHVRRLVGPVRR